MSPSSKYLFFLRRENRARVLPDEPLGPSSVFSPARDRCLYSFLRGGLLQKKEAFKMFPLTARLSTVAKEESIGRDLSMGVFNPFSVSKSTQRMTPSFPILSWLVVLEGPTFRFPSFSFGLA